MAVESNCHAGDGCWKADVIVTGADGRYSASDVIPGLALIKAGFLPGQANYASSESPFLELVDGSVETFDFALTPGVTIHGTVQAQVGGQPVANVHIELDTVPTTYVAEMITDASGNYSFSQLPADSYVVRTQIVGSLPYQDQFYAGHVLTGPSQGTQAADVIALTLGQSATANFSLIVGGHLLGTLIDSYSSLPIPDVDVGFQLLDTGATICCINFDTRSVHTDAQGRFELDGLSDTPFYLFAQVLNAPIGYPESSYGSTQPYGTFWSGIALTVPAGQTQDIDFRLHPAASVTGTVTRRSDGQPIAGAQIEAYVPGFLALRLTSEYGSTDSQGHYQLDGVIAGEPMVIGAFNASSGGVSYIDQIYDDQSCQFGSCIGRGEYVSAPEAQITPSIDFQLDPGASISGQVFGLYLYAWIYVYAHDGSMSTRVTTDTQGMFHTAGLDPGIYYLAASPEDTSLACTFYGGVTCKCETLDPCVTPNVAAIGAQPIVVGSTDVDNIVITVTASDFVFADGFE